MELYTIRAKQSSDGQNLEDKAIKISKSSNRNSNSNKNSNVDKVKRHIRTQYEFFK